MSAKGSRKLAVSRTVNQGASCHALKARANDLYETPQEATLALLRCPEPLPALIWEPAAGRGAISRVLRKAGHRVVTSDLVAHAGADLGIESWIDFSLSGASGGLHLHRHQSALQTGGRIHPARAHSRREGNRPAEAHGERGGRSKRSHRSSPCPPVGRNRAAPDAASRRMGRAENQELRDAVRMI